MRGARANCLALWSRENRAGNKSSKLGRVRGGAWDGGRQIEKRGNGVKVKGDKRRKQNQKINTIMTQYYMTSL